MSDEPIIISREQIIVYPTIRLCIIHKPCGFIPRKIAKKDFSSWTCIVVSLSLLQAARHRIITSLKTQNRLSPSRSCSFNQQ